jgi:hypothetical protein
MTKPKALYVGLHVYLIPMRIIGGAADTPPIGATVYKQGKSTQPGYTTVKQDGVGYEVDVATRRICFTIEEAEAKARYMRDHYYMTMAKWELQVWEDMEVQFRDRSEDPKFPVVGRKREVAPDVRKALDIATGAGTPRVRERTR